MRNGSSYGWLRTGLDAALSVIMSVIVQQFYPAFSAVVDARTAELIKKEAEYGGPYIIFYFHRMVDFRWMLGAFVFWLVGFVIWKYFRGTDKLFFVKWWCLIMMPLIVVFVPENLEVIHYLWALAESAILQQPFVLPVVEQPLETSYSVQNFLAGICVCLLFLIYGGMFGGWLYAVKMRFNYPAEWAGKSLRQMLFAWLHIFQFFVTGTVLGTATRHPDVISLGELGMFTAILEYVYCWPYFSEAKHTYRKALVGGTIFVLFVIMDVVIAGIYFAPLLEGLRVSIR